MRVALVGLGFMGATHARAWQRIEGAELYGVVSRDARKLEGYLDRVGGNFGHDAGRLDFSRVRKYHCVQDALADPEIEAIDLCLPTGQHAELATRALRSGKHVLVEKPLALTPEDADRAVREAQLCGRVLMCAHVLRFMPAYTEARSRLISLGRVRTAAFRRRCAAPAWSPWLRDAEQSGGGAFDLLIHDADYAHMLFGMPQAIRASGALDDERGLDLLAATLAYPNLSVTISGGWYLDSAFPFSMDFTIAGEEGVLEFSHGGLTLFRTGGTPELIPLGAKDPYEAEIRHFHDCAVSNRPSPICPPQQSADAVRLMRRMLQARQ